MNSLHYAPSRNWVNDPNGLLYHNGRYHLFFQYNPLGIEHANLSWGHASSVDLINWDDHPVAIAFDDAEEVFSGSVVVDEAGTTGFGAPGVPALVAFYTSMSKTAARQVQSIAYSVDDGMTWTKYSGNPVIDRGSPHFRDPKVFRWHGAEESYWVMVAVEAIDRQVVFYRSHDLLSWEFLSEFGAVGAVGGEWECPDLFPLRVDGASAATGDDRASAATGDDGASGEVRWVLLVSLNPGGIAGGSGTQYFVGDFDGRAFTPSPGASAVDAADAAGMRGLGWLDYGRDCYAGVSFAGLADDERTLIAWMSNWDYARVLPVDPDAPQRGQMTLARRLSLVGVDGQVRLRQVPVVPAVTTDTVLADAIVGEVSDCVVPLPAAGRIEVSVALEGAAGFVARLVDDADRCVVLTYDASVEELILDRRHGGDGFPAAFESIERMPVAVAPVITLTIWLDERAVEIYAEDGTRVLTELLGAVRASSLHLAGRGGEVRVREVAIGAVTFAVCG
ncbi:MAG: glycoside hydrolase family 32 protein [Gordonia sp. (in: high G+C Gram-positive bacteria)]